MKSLLTFLTFNVVLLICCYEKECAGSMKESGHIEPINEFGIFTAEFNTDKSAGGRLDSHMHILIKDGFLEYSNVIGAINSRSEMILIESENGKITRTFQGKYQKAGKEMMVLYGIWKSTNNTMLTRFSSNKVMLGFDQPEAFSVISKKQ